MYIFEYNPPIELHDKLNPVLWNDEEIRRQIQVKLLQIAKEFYHFLSVSAPIEDVLITGSQSNYNYTNWSDIDLHIVLDYDNISCEGEAKNLLDAKRKLWKRERNIKLKGIPVECYAEDLNQPAVTASYSLIHNKWVKRPGTPIKNYDVEGVKELYGMWKTVIKDAIKFREAGLLKRVKELLATFRRKSLAKDGEFGNGNLAFKALRNSGWIERLMKAVDDLEDQELSLKD